MSARHAESEFASLPVAVSRPESPSNRRIALVAAVVVGELWALNAAIEAWSQSNVSVLGWIIGFQAVSFLLALRLSTATPRRPSAHSAPASVGSRHPLAAAAD